MKTVGLFFRNDWPAVKPITPTLVTLLLIVLPLFDSMTARATVYQVGPTRTLYHTLQSVAGVLHPGDVVEVDGDVIYPGNVTFERHGTEALPITVQGLRFNGRRPLLSGTNLPAQTPAVVQLLGDHYIFQGFEINGALNTNIFKCGLYHNADQVIVRDTLVHDCYYNGIQGADAAGSLTLDKVEVFNCGNGLKYHQIYVGTDNVNHSNAVFRMQFCYLHDSRGGNNVKSRAGRTEIYYNWIEKAAYHELDLIGIETTNAAQQALVREDADVVGNVFYKHGTSKGLVARLGSDGTGESDARYRFVNNTIVLAGTYSSHVLRVTGARESVELHNNVIYRNGGGGVKLVDSVNPTLGPADGFYGFNNWLPTNSTYVPVGLTNTLLGTNPFFANAAGFDFMPTNASALLDAGQLPTQSPTNYPFPSPLAAPLYLPPSHTSPDPVVETTRPDQPPIDIGAYEATPLPPVILQHPANLVKLQGQSASFTVTAAGSLTVANPLRYQWYFNSLALTDATNTSFTIPLVETNAAGNYLAVVTNTFGAVTSSAASLAVNLDTSKPSVTITSPVENAIITTNQVLLKGTAYDNVVVKQVWVKLNDAGFVLATVSNGSAGNSTWSLLFTVPPGTNKVWASSTDSAGNVSVTNSRKLFFALPSLLTVGRIGEGTITPNYNGSNLLAGRNYLMTALPANTNWLFTNWLSVTDGVTNVASSLPKYSFPMQTNLTLVAQFVPNRFIAAAGKYNGLFSDTNSGVVARESAGFFTVKVTSQQKFSGSLSLAGEQRDFAGTFDLSGTSAAAKPVTFKGNTNTVTIRLQLPFDDSDTISGTVSNNTGSWVSDLHGDRAVFSTNHPPLDFLGRYTLVLPHSTNGPAGDGYGVVNIGSNGLINVLGNLGDGVAWSQSVPVSKYGEWPLFMAAYPTTNSGVKLKAGFIMGWASASNGLSGTLYWIKTPVPTDVFYPGGFSNEISILSSTYTNSALSTNAIITLTNAALILDGGNLAQALSNSVALSALNKFTCSTNYGLKLSVTKATGKLTGTFNSPAKGGLLTPIAGVVLQNGNTGQGVFKGTNQTGAFTLSGDD